MVRLGSIKNRGNGNREVYYLQVLEEVRGRPQGAPWGRQDRLVGCGQREILDLGHILFLESIGGVLWGSWAESALVNSIRKEQGVGKLLVTLI